jgi:DNA-binding transcriptional ArsR family regulator
VIRIELTDEDLERTRLALSPLWELVASLFILHSASPPPEYDEWIARTRRAFEAADLGPLRGLLPIRDGGPSYVPDFVAPIPIAPLAAVQDEIEAVRATEPDVVRSNLAADWGVEVPAPWDAFAARPVEMLDRLADDLHTYWQATLAEDWPRLRAVLEGEMLGRARALALLGPAAVLEELHPKVRWRRPVMELDKHKDIELHLEGRPLVLIPLVFARSVLLGNAEQGAVGIGYQARGTAQLWARDEPGGAEPLEMLLGHGRAAVLRALAQPATTTELARRLGYAPSTVSAHLDVLARAALVERHRVRRSVFYGLNDTGASLVALLADRPQALTA